ncbi:hypothetical protein [Methanonatronarchaeum sp. AMET-Sl]|uniref:hypothetical protein n=1 Tax=Methanonatronarchaeum sp. AMET-Sl TaxID=3037654 RepID=UPI00244DBC65|nr:hypothetical protein [Methanonatronarchaeum sp. AMET-Sl]WGI16856.1 hypothetical protein QEN48_04995 [Methanonatronarchaeum sp. AMET-Sl]
MNKVKLIAISTLILAVLIVPGCIDIGDIEAPIYPGAEEIDIEGVEEEVQAIVPWEDTNINTYTTEDTPEEVQTWYNDEMDELGWEKQYEDYGATFWTANDQGIAIQIIEPDVAEAQYDIDKTIIITITTPTLEQ